MSSVRSRSSGPAPPRLGSGFQRSLSPARYRSSFSSSHGSSSSSSSAFALSFNGFPAGSLSPAHSMNLRRLTPCGNVKPNNSNNNNNLNGALPRIKPKKTCMCSPTNHPGSFRCSLHRNASLNVNNNSSNSRSRGLMDGRRSAMRNSLVRICSVEGDFMLKRALASLIRPSSHQVRRRSDFHPTPSKLSRMTRAEDSDFILPGSESPL